LNFLSCFRVKKNGEIKDNDKIEFTTKHAKPLKKFLCISCYSLILEQSGKFAAGHAVQVLGDLQQDDESSPGKYPVLSPTCSADGM
jgi:hypothetical protein